MRCFLLCFTRKIRAKNKVLKLNLPMHTEYIFVDKVLKYRYILEFGGDQRRHFLRERTQNIAKILSFTSISRY